jgi:formylglycine-generating enzyme required for sulfatase activity
MGSDAFFPEEGPVHEASVHPFAIARHAVTNAEFASFVEQTGYVTVAERRLNPDDFGAKGPLSADPGPNYVD